MASDYGTGSPNSDLLSIGGAMGVASDFGGGSQLGSDYGFGTPQSLGMDTLMQGGRVNGSNEALRSADFASSYRSAAGAMPINVQGYGSAFDTAGLQPGSSRSYHRDSMSNLLDATSPALGHHHRLSISSNGQYLGLDRHNSMAESDAASPGPGARGNIGENALAGNSNDTVDKQAGDENTSRSFDASAYPPAWSELKTKAGKERKRLPLACIACRRKKIRCSGEKPACKHCLRSRIPCVYKVTTRKAAPRTDYMAMLDKRLKRMEERVIKIIPKDEQGIVETTGRANVKPTLSPLPSKNSNGSSKKRAAELAFGDELDEWANARPSIPETKDDAVTSIDRQGLKPQDAEERSLLQEGKDKLPPKAVQQHLAEVFFDYVYGQSYHLLHRPSFMRKLEQGTVPPVLTLAVCAISARFSNHPDVRSHPAFLRGESWAAAAREIALRRYDTPNITILIVYLILGLHEFGTCQGGRSWMFGGMAQRMAYALQLHKDLDYDPKSKDPDSKNTAGEGLSFTDREIRRRTMWSCFLMDRFNSSGTDRPVFVAEQYIRAQLPVRENYFQMEITGPTEDLEGAVPCPVEPNTGQPSNVKDNMGVAAYMIRLVAIWGRLIHYLNLGGKERDQHPMWAPESIFMGIRRATDEWRETLPESLHYSSQNLQSHASERIANQFIFLHIVYNQITLFMNRFALPGPGNRHTYPSGTPEAFVQNAQRLAMEAANQISELVHTAMDHVVVAPFAGYSAFFSSTVHIHGAFSKNNALKTSSQKCLQWNVQYLDKMKKYWGMFHFVTENLRDLYRQHADVARLGANPTRTEDSNKSVVFQDGPIFQYGDWFDRYPHGVNGTDFEEPSIEIKKEPGSDAVLGQKSDLQTVEEFFSKLSPPSRAAQSARPQKKAMKKRNSSKNDSKAAASATARSRSQVPPQPPDAANMVPSQQHRPQRGQHALPNEVLAVAHVMPHPIDDLQHHHHSLAYPPGYQQPPNALIVPGNGPPQFMSQLDRQMVFDSYAGIDPSSTTTSHTHSHHQHPHAMLLDLSPSTHSTAAATGAAGGFDAYNLDPFSPAPPPPPPPHAPAAASDGVWGDPSAAWFMPFNMHPPAIGDDHNLYSSQNAGAFDWATTFAGYGDLSAGLAPMGLTPRVDGGEGVVDAGQEEGLMAEDGAVLEGLEGLDGL